MLLNYVKTWESNLVYSIILLYTSYPYPSCACVDWTKTINGCVLIEVLWHRQAQEDREA